jgi:DNA polymerase-3 subunit epsilon
MSNFVAIDFETAVRHHICAVGIVTVENSKIIEEYYTLVRPPRNDYNWYCTQVHGITSYDTVNSLPFIEIYPEIKKRLFGKIVVVPTMNHLTGMFCKNQCLIMVWIIQN